LNTSWPDLLSFLYSAVSQLNRIFAAKYLT
jgi:hypothetical protein